jgi:hypothetical protein
VGLDSLTLKGDKRMLNTERNAKILWLVSLGVSYGKVAEDVGVTRQVVAGVVYRNRETAPNPKRARARTIGARKITDGVVMGKVSQLADMHDISRDTAYKRAANGTYGWGFV